MGGKMEDKVKEGQIALSGERPTLNVLEVNVAMTADEFARLQKIIVAKQVLIDHALESDHVFVEQDENSVFLRGLSDAVLADHRETCTRFLLMIVRMAQKLTRVNSRKFCPENEKYAFRCFLIRLGMIGSEYKLDRAYLLSHLPGSAAYKHGAPRSEIGL